MTTSYALPQLMTTVSVVLTMVAPSFNAVELLAAKAVSNRACVQYKFDPSEMLAVVSVTTPVFPLTLVTASAGGVRSCQLVDCVGSSLVKIYEPLSPPVLITHTSPVCAVSLSISALLEAVNVFVMAKAGSTAVSSFPSLPSTGTFPDAVPVFLVAADPSPLIFPTLIPLGMSDALRLATPVTMPLALTVTFVYVPAVKACPARAVVMARLEEPLKLPEPVTSPDRLIVREDDNRSALATLPTEAVPVELSTVTLPVPLDDLMPPQGIAGGSRQAVYYHIRSVDSQSAVGAALTDGRSGPWQCRP